MKTVLKKYHIKTEDELRVMLSARDTLFGELYTTLANIGRRRQIMRNNNKFRQGFATATDKRGFAGDRLAHTVPTDKATWSFVVSIINPPKTSIPIYNRIFKNRILFRLYGLFAAACWRIGNFFFRRYILFEHRYDLFLSDSVSKKSD